MFLFLLWSWSSEKNGKTVGNTTSCHAPELYIHTHSVYQFWRKWLPRSWLCRLILDEIVSVKREWLFFQGLQSKNIYFQLSTFKQCCKLQYVFFLLKVVCKQCSGFVLKCKGLVIVQSRGLGHPFITKAPRSGGLALKRRRWPCYGVLGYCFSVLTVLFSSLVELRRVNWQNTHPLNRWAKWPDSGQ